MICLTIISQTALARVLDEQDRPGPTIHPSSKIRNTQFPYKFFLRDAISNIGKSNRHVNCLCSEGKAINSKMIKTLSLNPRFCRLRANSKNRLAASGGDCWTGKRETLKKENHQNTISKMMGTIVQAHSSAQKTKQLKGRLGPRVSDVTFF